MGHAPGMVATDNTAVTMGSGTLPVLATPAIVALVEQAASQAISSYLPPGMTTVGTGLALRHLAATPLGHNIQAEAILTRVSGRKLEYKVAAYDEREKIAEGTHERFIVDVERFMAKMSDKKPKGIG
jgi:predicted thioesterase